MLLLGSAPARAQELEHFDEPFVEIHGFLSQGFIKTTENDYLAESERGSFEFSEVGVNFTKALSDRLSVGFQLFARDIGPIGNYQPQFDWYYLDYRFADWFGIRAGRTKLPIGLYNESSDIDAAHVPVLLPQSVYPLQLREALLAQTGAELYGLVQLGSAGDLEYRLFGGTIFLDTANAAPELRELHIPYMAGTRLLYQPPIDGLTLGASLELLRLDLDYTLTPEQHELYAANGWLPSDFDGTASARVPMAQWIASVEYQIQDLSLAAEYGRTYARVESSLSIPEPSEIKEAYYVMASYRVRSWFTPGVYYSLFRPDFENRRGVHAYQHDLALTLRYDLDPHWILKLEGHYMHGTAGLQSELNAGKPLTALEEDWAIFLAKTTAYF